MKTRLITFMTLLAVGCPLMAEEKKSTPTQQTAEESAKENELVVPKTLDEAHAELERQLPKDELAKIDAMKSEDEMIDYHFSLGMSMRNSWGLWGDGPLARHMKELGFTHADDMSSAILETFWCKRHKKDYRLKERAAYYAAYWKSVARPPETVKDPRDGSELDWSMSFGADSDDKTPRMIHIGKSKKTGRWLAYEHDKGVYEPDAALLERITESQRSDFTHPLPPLN